MGLHSWPVLMKHIFLTSTHLSNLDEITAELKSQKGQKTESEDRQSELIHSLALGNPDCIYWVLVFTLTLSSFTKTIFHLCFSSSVC